MERHKPYPAYRDSGIPWLGKVPKHWEAKRMRFVCRINPQKSEIASLPKNTEVSFLPMEAISEDGQLTLDETRQIGEVWQGYTYFRNGDVVVAKITPCFENGKGAIGSGLTQGIGFGTTELHVFRPPHDVDARFIFYLSKSSRFRKDGTASMYGAAGQQRVPEEFIKNYLVALPDYDEQRAMAEFLDREIAKLDALVTKKEQLIALLQERRSALITHTLTKGLNPNAPMRDSGIEWVGKTPRHWMAKRLRYCAESLQTGPFGSQLHSEDYTSGGTPLVNPAQINAGKIIPDYECSVDAKTAERLARHQLFEGDIVFGRRGEMGRCALVTEHEVGWLCGTGSLRIRLQRDVLAPHFAFWALSTKGISEWLLLESVGTTMDNLNTEILGEIPLGVPPVDEQLQIVTFLDRETGKIDALIARVRDGIKALSEYRTALISAVVTGRIAVDASASH